MVHVLDGANDEKIQLYGRRDLNPHARKHRNLNPACIPISPLPRKASTAYFRLQMLGERSVAGAPVLGGDILLDGVDVLAASGPGGLAAGLTFDGAAHRVLLQG
jgi:hypothetical protein